MIASKDDKRIIRVTAGNLRNDHFSIAGLYDFFPADSFGGSRRAAKGKPVFIKLDGLDRVIDTDIPAEARTGKPRRQLRERTWVGEFFRFHGVRADDCLELHRTDDRHYCLRVCREESELARPFRVSELFAGIGLVRLALERHGFKVVFANDIDADKLAMYRDNFTAEEFRLGDIHRIAGAEVPDCDLMTASFPCTDLSIAGEMNGIHSGESSAFWAVTRLLQEMGERRPPLVLLENVPGFLMSHDGRDFESALLALNNLGYAVDALFLDAANFTPQSRLRLFVVGKLGADGGHPFGLSANKTRPEALLKFVHTHSHIKWDVRSLSAPPTRSVTLHSIIEDLNDNDPMWWGEERSAYFMGQLSERHLAVAREMMRGRCYSYATAFRRVRNGRSMAELRNDGLAGCLRTPKGGSGRQILFKGGRGRYQVRLMTARECARLQGVPDCYKINVPLNQALFGFGDAVCVPAVEWVAQQYLRQVLNERVNGSSPWVAATVICS